MRKWVIVILVGAPFVSCGGDRSCADVEHDADQLVTANQSCTEDAQCLLISVDAPCLLRLQCDVVVNTSTDLDEFRARATKLADEHRDACNVCAEASCVAPSSLKAVCSGGVCTSTQNQ